MSLDNSTVVPALSAGGYTIDQSLRFNRGDSPYLNRTPSSSGDIDTFTLSFWIKRSSLGTSQFIYSSGVTNANGHIFFDDATDKLYIMAFNSSGANGSVVTDMVFKDVSSWYHIVISFDTVSYSTRTDDITVYVNGQEVSITGANYNTPTDTVRLNDATVKTIGESNENGGHLNGYLSEFYFIDGQALDSSYFGETGDYGEWKPIEYTGSYGTNGFYLDFDGTYYNDKSGNGNNFSATNLSTADVTLDSPTNNFATMNPLRMSTTAYLAGATQGTFTEGNLKVLGASGGTGSAGYMNEAATFTMDKFYVECGIQGDSSQIGVMDESYTGGSYGSLNSTGTVCISGSNITSNNSNVYTGLSWTSGNIIGIAMNHTSEKVWFSINGVWQGSGTQNPATGDGGYSTSGVGTNMFFAVGDGGSDAGGGWVNFGQESTYAGNKAVGTYTDENGYGLFKYSVPSGYLALCTANLPTPDVIPTEHFNTVLYSGTGASNAITGVGFQPDWLWIKRRNAAYSHRLLDVIRGTDSQLMSNTNESEESATAFSSFDTDGFTVTGTDNSYNASSGTYVAWNWKANGSGVSNTDGSITSSVSANQDAGFSIVSYTGVNTAGTTVGHGLSQAPEMIMVKNRTYNSESSSGSWQVYHTGMDTTAPEDYKMALDSYAARVDTTSRWNDTAPTSTVFTLGSDWDVNYTDYEFIAYCFHSVDGFSKFGSYVGNSSADGTFVYTGFRPAYVMVKSITNDLREWYIFDNVRDPDNSTHQYLRANTDAAEGTASNDNFDFVSNGFKIRVNDSYNNSSSETYIYMCFAEYPFKYSNAR